MKSKPKQLKLCPFCGSEAKFTEHDAGGLSGIVYWIRCTKCESGTTIFFKNLGGKKKCIATWNRRVENK